MKYEYLVLYDAHNPSIESDVHAKILNAQGTDGWELIQVVAGVPTPRGDLSFVYYFKRPIVA